jgi:hypothetical protein
LSEIEVVNQVFFILDNFSTLDVGYRFVSLIPQATLLNLVKTKKGLGFCKTLLYWLLYVDKGNTNQAVAPNVDLVPQLMRLKQAIDNAPPPKDEQTKSNVAGIAYNDGSGVRIEVPSSSGQRNAVFYQANKSGMIDVRELSRHPAAKFIVADGQNVPEEFLSSKSAAALFNVAQSYSEIYPSDEILVFTAGSVSNGKPGTCGGAPCHATHQQGSCIDIRYMDDNGKSIKGDSAYKSAGIERTLWLIKTFGKDGFNKIYTGDDTRFGLPDNTPKSRDAVEKVHRHHLHVGY